MKKETKEEKGMKKKKQKAPEVVNLVAKHARKCNKSAVFVDRKKAKNRGYSKHNGQEYHQKIAA